MTTKNKKVEAILHLDLEDTTTKSQLLALRKRAGKAKQFKFTVSGKRALFNKIAELDTLEGVAGKLELGTGTKGASDFKVLPISVVAATASSEAKPRKVAPTAKSQVNEKDLEKMTKIVIEHATEGKTKAEAVAAILETVAGEKREGINVETFVKNRLNHLRRKGLKDVPKWKPQIPGTGYVKSIDAMLRSGQHLVSEIAREMVEKFGKRYASAYHITRARLRLMRKAGEVIKLPVYDASTKTVKVGKEKRAFIPINRAENKPKKEKPAPKVKAEKKPVKKAPVKKAKITRKPKAEKPAPVEVPAAEVQLA